MFARIWASLWLDRQIRYCYEIAEGVGYSWSYRTIEMDKKMVPPKEKAFAFYRNKDIIHVLALQGLSISKLHRLGELVAVDSAP
jgi:hypothetical protein